MSAIRVGDAVLIEPKMRTRSSTGVVVRVTARVGAAPLVAFRDAAGWEEQLDASWLTLLTDAAIDSERDWMLAEVEKHVAALRAALPDQKEQR